MRAWVVAVMVLAGCGGSGETARSTERPPSTTAGVTTPASQQVSEACRSSFAEASTETGLLLTVRRCGSVAEWVAAGSATGKVTSSNFEASLARLYGLCVVGQGLSQKLPICLEAEDLVR